MIPDNKSEPTKIPVKDFITLADLKCMIESTVLTIMNDRLYHSAAEHSLESRGFLPIPLVRDAMRDSGDGLYSKFINLNKHPTHKVIIRHRIGMEVAELMDKRYKKKVSSLTIEKLAAEYHPKINWTGLESKITSHITATAFNEMREAEKVRWLNSLYEPDTNKDSLYAKDVCAFLSDKEPRNPCSEIPLSPNIVHAIDSKLEAMIHVKREGMEKQIKKVHMALLYGAGEEIINSTLTGIKPEKPMIPSAPAQPMNTSTAARNLNEVFGVIITGKDKASIMAMIRQAKSEVEAFADLDQSSAYVEKQVKTINAGIKELYAELDK